MRAAAMGGAPEPREGSPAASAAYGALSPLKADLRPFPRATGRACPFHSAGRPPSRR
jgi:hypothetical protein